MEAENMTTLRRQAIEMESRHKANTAAFITRQTNTITDQFKEIDRLKKKLIDAQIERGLLSTENKELKAQIKSLQCSYTGAKPC